MSGSAHARSGGTPDDVRSSCGAGRRAPRLPLLVLVTMTIVPTAAVAADRDWRDVQLAWRGDPRAVADAPLGAEPPAGRRPSRRAQRRSLRRGVVTPDVPAARPPVATRAPLADRPSDPQPDPVELPDEVGILVHRDQPYGAGAAAHPRQRFDIHLPAACSGGPMPLVVWIHGRDWRTGSKADCPVVWLVNRGYVVASVGYRPSDAAVFPAQLDDCRAAIATLVADADTWGIDPTRICVAGVGAGGHLAALVAVDTLPPPGAVRKTGNNPGEPTSVDVAALSTFGAPTDLTTLGVTHDRPGSAASRLVGGPLREFREVARQASPRAHVSIDDPPALVVHGGRDALVPADQAVQFARALEASGVDAKLVIIDRAADVVPEKGSPQATALLEFLDLVLRPGPARRPSD